VSKGSCYIIAFNEAKKIRPAIGGFIGAFDKYATLMVLQNDWTEPNMPKFRKPKS